MRKCGAADIPLGGARAVTRCWLIRHGEPEEHAWGKCYGSLDVGLSAAGREQMAQVASYLRGEPIAAIYTSPRTRARESADALSRPVEVIDDLREIDFGDFEGLTYDEIAAQHPQLYAEWMQTPTQIRFPNGESFPDMRLRVLNAFDRIRRKHENQTVAIVSHGGVNRILLAWALEMPDHCLFRLAQDYAAINLLAFPGGVPSVQLMGGR
jgi:alpha-ribazole phosphatase